MATLEDTSPIPELTTGILQPKQQNRWRLSFLPNVPIIDEIKQLVRLQIISFKFNYHLQVLEMVIEQNMNNTHLHTLVKQLSKFSRTNDYNKISFVIEELDGNEEVVGRFLFGSCKMLDHDYVLDYAMSDACRHWLKFSFKETKDLT